MGTGCTNEPKVIETNKNRRQIIDMKNKIKLEIKKRKLKNTNNKLNLN